MQLLEYLRQHAAQNVWCSPFQDRQAILKLARLTPFGGVRHRFNIGWITLNLPEQNDSFHVYQVGQNAPIDLGLFPNRGVWIKMSDMANTRDMIVDLYFDNGVQYPRSEAWICRTHDKNFVICVKELNRVADLNHQDLNVRFYTNAFFGSPRGAPYKTLVACNGKLVKTAADISAFQAEVQALVVKKGYVYLFHNGRYVNDISPARVIIGDVVEYVYDPSIEAVLDFPVSSLPSFRSTLDTTDKYLIHPPKRGDAKIFYRDDIDVWLIKKETGNYINGIYYHRNREDSLRMVTHRDYSVPTAYVLGYAKDDKRWKADTRGLIVRMHIRNSGYDRPLVFEHHRIHELYKLTDVRILRAMQGLDGVLEEWKADSLESSHYTYLMRCWYQEITGMKTVCAYGYNAIAKLIGDSPIEVVNLAGDINYAPLPWGLQTNSTMYEYDAEGLLLGFYTHQNGTRYYTTNPECTLVEGLMGIGGKQLDVWFGKSPLQLDPESGYRFYISPLVGGATSNEWREVTEEEGLYTLKDGVFTWKYDPTRYVGVVKGDNRFLSYSFNMDQQDDFYRFHIDYTDLQGIPLELPLGKLEIWITNATTGRGRSLIQNLDWYVNWPEVVIVNKEWLDVNGKNTITVRGTDWCTPDGKLIEPNQSGFIQHGLLSLNEIYNLRDDKVIRCVADGRTFHRTQLTFAEQKYGVRVLPAADLDDGRPYWISDVRVPLPGIIPFDTDAWRERSEIVDQKVSDYLGKMLTEPTFTNPVMIKRRYRVYSPLITKLIFDMNQGWFTPPVMPTSDKAVLDSMVDYLYILEFEPTRNNVDTEYVTIHPHPWPQTRSVTQNQYAFLERVISLYLGDHVDLTQFVTIKG